MFRTRRVQWPWVAVAVLAIILVAFAAREHLAAGGGPGQQTPLVSATGADADIDAATFRRIAEAQTPTVVSIRTESVRERQTADSLPPEFFEWFFGRPGGPFGDARPDSPDSEDRLVEGAGSGFIIDASGLILTNNHVVEGAKRIEVGLFVQVPPQGAAGDRTLEATIVGRDPLTDTALIQLVDKPAAPLAVATLGSSEAIAPGDWVVAIGNPFSLAHTVTVGVISAEGRPFVNIPGRQQRMLQTDAAINPGNSGGPLLNLRGEVVGINTAIFTSSPRMGNLGIGFAVPIDVVKELLPQLREGKVTRGRIGVQVTDVPPGAAKALGVEERRGALVSSVEPGGPAQDAGLRPGDVVVEYNGKLVPATETLVQMVSATAPGTRVPIRVIRDGKPIELRIAVEELTVGSERAQSRDADATGGFGLQLRDQRPGGDRAGAPAGPVVAEIEPRSPAARSGIRPGDIILEVNRKRISTAAEAAAAFRAIGREGVALVLVSRDGQEIFVTMNAAG